MDVLFLAFANSRENPLPTLHKEDEEIYQTLSPRALRQNFLLHRDSYASIDKIAQYITLYRDHLAIFLYSGHAGRDKLLLNEQEANAVGIAHLLGQCPKLKLVFLNGCSTQGQVAQLLENGIPVVIATSAPIDDFKATTFSIRFFRALQEQFSIKEAFELAKGAIMTEDAEVHFAQDRGLALRGDNTSKPLWGLFWNENKPQVLDWKLPLQTISTTPLSFTPNERFVEALLEGLSEYDDDVRKICQQAKKGITVSLSKKRMTILNTLPAPLAEHLRKLMVPVVDENAGYDKISEARLGQMVRTFSILQELIAFTMLAQLWEAFYDQEQLDIQPDQSSLIKDFFQLTEKEREQYDFLPLIRCIRQVFDQNDIRYFVEELTSLKHLIDENESFKSAYYFMQALQTKLAGYGVEAHEVSELCMRGEESLANLLSETGFMAKYTLAAVQEIDVVKFRHLRKARFNHEAVLLRDLLGGLEKSHLEMERFMDNRSVLMINMESKEYLNLSPFIIDENSFEDRTDVCKLYFFSHYRKAGDTWFFKYVNKPDDPLLGISANRHEIVWAQFEAFAELLWNQPMMSL